MERLLNVIALIHFLWVLIAVILAILVIYGLSRGKRDTGFYLSGFTFILYSLIVGANFYKDQPIRSWLHKGDEVRKMARAEEWWNLDPSSMTSIHLDWPLGERDGRLFFDCAGSSMSCSRMMRLADPDSGFLLEVGRDPVRRAELLIGDPQCRSDNPNIIQLRPEFEVLRTCLLVAPNLGPTADMRLTYNASRLPNLKGWHGSGEWSLETEEGKILDRITTIIISRDANIFLLPRLNRSSLSRRFSDFKDGPIVAVMDWLGERGDPPGSRREWLRSLRARVPLTGELLLAGLSGDNHWIALSFACSQWDRAGDTLRERISEQLNKQLERYPKDKTLLVCGRQSCTSDIYGLEDPANCSSAPPTLNTVALD